MDLTALWYREKTRLAAELHSNSVLPSTGETRASFSLVKDVSQPPTSNNRPKNVITVPSPTLALKNKSRALSTPNANYLSDRDRVFHLLIESSIAPLASETFGSNEFAMEYAGRAAGRFVPPPAPDQLGSASPAPPIATSSPSRGRHQSIRVASLPLHVSTPSSSVQVAQPAASTVTLTKNPPILARKNGRKRAEYSSQTLKPYVGDMFGTRGDYIDGLLYMSRMKRSYQVIISSTEPRGKKIEYNLTNLPWTELARVEGRNVLKDGVLDAFAVAGGEVSSATRHTGASIVVTIPTQDEGEPGSTLTGVQRKQQQRCSLTLSNWSFNPENARLMVQENVVEALIRLCKDGDKATRLHCVTALMNLSHLAELRRVIVQQGAVKTVAEIVNDLEDKTIRTACAITLCNLCSLQGQEGLLVDDGAVSALSTLINEHENVAHICRCALFNLTCVSQSYHKIESVLKAFLALTSPRNNSQGFAGQKEEKDDDITAKALCNLSNLTRIRLRLLEEGIVSAIAALLHPNSSVIHELLAYILLNLSRLPTCRNEMVAKGCMNTLVALAGASRGMKTKYLLGITLWNLSRDSGNAVRMVLEGLVMLVNDLCRRVHGAEDRESDTRRDFEDNGAVSVTRKDDELLQVCARTLFNVSCCEDARSKLVERDAVTTLSSISRRSSGNDAKQMCTLALCNLLSVQKAAADIVTAGAITALIQLSMASGQSYETRNLFSKALHGLCNKTATRSAVTEAGVVPALLFLSSLNEVYNQDDVVISEQSARVLSEIRARCTAAFACLATDVHTAAQVCNAAVVQCVTRILVLERFNVASERFCCSCLSLLCRDEQCSRIMVEVGAIEKVLATCVESQDRESKASCCHVLASVSCHPSCCLALVRLGVISVLATLAKIKDDASIQRCCAITLANLSVEPELRETLASAGIVAIVSVLSNSYSEDSQRDCAKVLCNLSCIRGKEAALVTEGAVGVLMMISMVRAVSLSTKETCICAILNLLNAETMKHMVKEGLVKILVAYAGLASKQVATLVTQLFGKLLTHPVGRNALCIERTSLHALFELMTYDCVASRSDERELASLHEKLLSQLVYYENSRLLSVQTGILDALHRISMYEDQYATVHKDTSCAEKTLALVFFTLAKSDDSRMAVASSSNLWTVLKFLNLHTAKNDCEAPLYAAATLCWLGWHEDTRRFLYVSEIPCALTQMLQIHANHSDEAFNGKEELVSYSSQAIRTCVLTLCCLAHSKELLEVMLKENVVTYLNSILPRSSLLAIKSPLYDDEEFVALVCILFRQLSHVTGFATAISHQPAPILDLFCTLVQHVVAKHDVDSSLDCADALCSIVFAEPQHTTSISIASRPSQPPRPSRYLVEKRVLEAIGSLLSDEQLPDTRWRCAASLWALSSVSAYRRELVELGVTSMLVNESYRAVKLTALNTLQCCAGTLCNLTIVPEDKNSAQMVAEGAMPALIQLAKLENETIREHCTLALSNLSGPSPKVESGAVSALLNLSLDLSTASMTSSPASRRTSEQQSVWSRPPLVNGERHKQLATLPNYTIELTQDNSMDEQKVEAELVASTPPAPRLPTIAADLVSSSTRVLDSDADTATWKSETTQADEGGYEYMETKFFDKLEPEESFALMTATEEREGADDEMWAETRPMEYTDNQEQDFLGDGIAISSSQRDVTHSLCGNSGHRVGASDAGLTSNYTLSPLSRVVTRKTHAAHAAHKFKDVSKRKVRKDGEIFHKLVTLGSQSSPCLTKSTRDSEPLSESVRSTDSYSSSERKTRDPAPASRIPSQLASLSVSASVSSFSASFGTNECPIDTEAALLAAVSASGLYGASPSRVQSRLDDTKDNSISLNVKQQKKSAMNRRRKEQDVGNSELLVAQSKAATTIEEFRGQAKLFGLWS